MKLGEKADSMLSGQVGLMLSQTTWSSLRTQTLLANVEISGVRSYQLEYCHASSGRILSYRLLNTKAQEVDVWKFTSSWNAKTLPLHGVKGNHRVKRLEYKIGMFGGRYFVTEKGKKPIYMELTDHSRAFELDGMFFKHVDFQSHIHFLCEKKKVNQAILVASLIFNPPLTSEAS